jgi:Zn-dependent protease with chaperone function
MIKRGPLLLMMIAVPVFSFAVASGLLWKWEHDFQEMLAKQYPDATAEQRAAVTYLGACTIPEFRAAAGSNCSTLTTVSVMRWASIATAASGLGWLAIIAIAGRFARRNRGLLLHVFRPGLYLTNAFLVALIAIHAVLAIAAIYLGESALVGRVHVGIIALIGIGAALGVAAIAKVSFGLVTTATASVIGKIATADNHPALWDLARDVAREVRVRPPQNIVVGLEPNFFVTQARVHTLDGELSGRTMFVSLPLSRIMTRDELRSVLGHELAHYKGRDTEFSTKFYPIYRGTHDGLRHLYVSGGESAASIALAPALAILSFFLEAFEVAEKGIGRMRELAADKIGAAITDVHTTAAALAKIHAFASYWQPIRDAMAGAVAEGKAYINVSSLFAEAARANATAEALNGLDDRRLSHPTDSHPPLSVRLENLGVTLAQVETAALLVAPEHPAVNLIAEHEAIETHLSEVEHYILAKQAGLVEPSQSPAPE